MTKMFSIGNRFKQSYELALLNKGELFGEESLGKDGNRMTSVTCISGEGELLEIDKEKFFKRTVGPVWDLYNSKHIQRMKWMKRRIKQIEGFIENNKEPTAAERIMENFRPKTVTPKFDNQGPRLL